VGEGVSVDPKGESFKGESNMVDNRDGSWPARFGCLEIDQVALDVDGAQLRKLPTSQSGEGGD
jgi:hypothetical protein